MTSQTVRMAQLSQLMTLSRILRTCHTSKSLHGPTRVPQMYLHCYRNQGGTGILTVGMNNQQTPDCLSCVRAPLVARTYAGVCKSQGVYALYFNRTVTGDYDPYMVDVGVVWVWLSVFLRILILQKGHEVRLNIHGRSSLVKRSQVNFSHRLWPVAAPNTVHICVSATLHLIPRLPYVREILVIAHRRVHACDAATSFY